jgi:hypothetical protein
MVDVSLDGVSFFGLAWTLKLLHTDKHMACQAIYHYIVEPAFGLLGR